MSGGMSELESLYADLNTAARFLMDDGFSIENTEAIRIGMRIAELVGMMKQAGGTTAPHNR